MKSMSRKKSPAFRQLLGYFFRDGLDERQLYTRNLYAFPERGNWMQIAKEFEENERLLKPRVRGNHCYHEIIALPYQSEVSKARQTDILRDLAEQYLAKRAPNQLAVGYVHSDTRFMHIHLMLSANEIKSNRRVRLSRAELQTIVRELEDYKFERYPELVGERLHGRDETQHDRVRVAAAGYEAARRQGHTLTQTEQVREAVSQALAGAYSQDEVAAKLKANGLALYQRGKTLGIENAETGKRYRLKTLGLLSAFEQASERHALVAQREQALAVDRQRRLSRAAERELDGWERMR